MKLSWKKHQENLVLEPNNFLDFSCNLLRLSIYDLFAADYLYISFISGRKEIIAEFKVLVSSFPEDMGRMQTQLSKYKEAASDVHSLRADVQSLSIVLDRKVGVMGI